MEEVDVSRDESYEVVAYSKSWNFMKTTYSLCLPTIVEAIYLTNDLAHGRTSTLGADEDMLEVGFGGYLDFYQAVSFPKQDPIDVVTVENNFIGAADDVLTYLRYDGAVAWRMKCCSTYAEALVCNTCKDSFVIEIRKNNFLEFGEMFNERFERRMQEFFPQCKTFTVVTQIYDGNLPEQELAEQYNMDKFTEMAILVTKYTNNFEQANFWKKEAVSTSMHSKPNEEFYPGLMNKYGDYVFKSQQIAENGVQISKVRFCGEMFLRNDDGSEEQMNLLFARPFFADFLAGNKDDLYRENKLYELEWLSDFRVVLERYVGADREDYSGARREVLLKKENPNQQSVQQMLKVYQKTFGQEIKEGMVKSFSMDQIQTYLSNNVLPPFLTLESLVGEKVNCLQSNTVYTRRYDDLKLASLCEAILCFVVHGTCLSSDGKPMQPNQLLNDFRLDPSTFTKGADLLGLGNLPNVGVVDGKIKILDYAKVPLYVKLE